MKRLLWIPLLFLCSTLWAAEPVQLARMNPYILGAQASAAATTNYCNDANAVGCWYMNSADGGDGSQTETDRTANGNDLSVSASDTIPSSDTVPSGYSGNSRDFEGSESDYLTIADGTELDISGADAKISICAWVNLESVPALSAYGTIVAKYNPTGNLRQYWLAAEGTGSDQFKFTLFLSKDSTSGEASAETVSSTTTTYTAGNWYHVCAVYNDVDMRIYVGGSLHCTPVEKTDGIFDGSAIFTIGITGGLAQAFDGLIDEVIVFNREISSTEVSAIYTNGISGNKGASD